MTSQWGNDFPGKQTIGGLTEKNWRNFLGVSVCRERKKFWREKEERREEKGGLVIVRSLSLLKIHNCSCGLWLLGLGLEIKPWLYVGFFYVKQWKEIEKKVWWLGVWRLTGGLRNTPLLVGRNNSSTPMALFYFTCQTMCILYIRTQIAHIAWSLTKKNKEVTVTKKEVINHSP